MTVSANRAYLPAVDHIRAFAAILVVLYHGLLLFGTELAKPGTVGWLTTRNPFLTIVQEGHTGVGLFIVLSGFILTVGVVGKSVQYGAFLKARVLRIYPMMLVCVIVAANSTPNNVIGLLSSLLQTGLPGGVSGHFAGILWIVALEFQCYLVFPFLLMFSNERGWRFLVQVVALALIFRFMVTLSDAANPRDISYWTVVGRIDQFCIGMIAARIYVERRLDALKPYWFLLVAPTIIAGFMVFNRYGGLTTVHPWKVLWPTIEGVMWAIAILTYLPFGRRLPSVLSRPIAFVGEISYSIYLLHYPLILALTKSQISLRPFDDIAWSAVATTCLLVLPIVTPLAALSYYTIEKPFLSLRPRYVAAARPENRADTSVRTSKAA